MNFQFATADENGISSGIFRRASSVGGIRGEGSVHGSSSNQCRFPEDEEAGVFYSTKSHRREQGPGQYILAEPGG
jgi:hypothetical protein